MTTTSEPVGATSASQSPAGPDTAPAPMSHREVLEVANPYLGPCPSVRTDWTPLKNWFHPFEKYGHPRPSEEDLWQFGTFRFFR